MSFDHPRESGAEGGDNMFSSRGSLTALGTGVTRQASSFILHSIAWALLWARKKWRDLGMVGGGGGGHKSIPCEKSLATSHNQYTQYISSRFRSTVYQHGDLAHPNQQYETNKPKKRKPPNHRLFSNLSHAPECFCWGDSLWCARGSMAP